MPLLGFTKLKAKLLDGSKTQTIRKPRKTPFEVGDTLHIYWKLRTKQCQKLGTAKVTNIIRKKLSELTEDDAIKDGFERTSVSSARKELVVALLGMHKDLRMNSEVDVITFEWTKKEWLNQ